MHKRSVFVYIIGSVIIGLAAMLGVVSILIFGGVIDSTPRSLVFVSGSAEQVYNGDALVCDEWTLKRGELRDGHTPVVTFTGSQTTVGTSDNTFHVLILDSNGADVTEDYGITLVCGKLTVNKRFLEISSVNVSFTFGADITDKPWEAFEDLPDDALMGEDHVVFEDIVFEDYEEFDVGTYQNKFDVTSVVILDGDGKDVTNGYSINAVFGFITVQPIELDIVLQRSNNNGNSVIYDAKVTGVLDGHYYALSNDGNKISFYSETDDSNVTYKYKINHIEYRVKDNMVYNTNTQYYKVTSAVSGTVYLRETSYGDYSNSAMQESDVWQPAKSYTKTVTNNPLQFSYDSMESNNSTSRLTLKRLNGAPYVTPYYSDLSSETDHNDVTIEKEYSGDEYSFTYIPIPKNENYTLGSEINSSEEETYMEYVYDTYLQLPEETRIWLIDNVIIPRGLDSGSDRILRAANVVRSRILYNLNYDDGWNTAEDYAIYFFTGAKTGVCRHYATAATALFRAMGIPARYTVGFLCEGLTANKEKTITGKSAHAWAEIYLDGKGWMPVEVTGGEYMVKPYDIFESVIDNPDASTSYDDYLGLQGSMLQTLCADNGYHYEFTVDGTQKGVGKSSSTITSFTLYDADDNDITDYYSYRFYSGIIHNYLYEITVETEGDVWPYDGTWHSKDGYTVTDGLDDMESRGHEIDDSKVYNSNIRDVGAGIQNVVNGIKIMNGSADITDAYHITYDYGILKILPISFGLEFDGQLEITGSEFTDDSVEIQLDKDEEGNYSYNGVAMNFLDENDNPLETSPLLEGHSIASLIFVADSSVELNYDQPIAGIKIVNANSEDVSQNYSVYGECTLYVK